MAIFKTLNENTGQLNAADDLYANKNGFLH